MIKRKKGEGPFTAGRAKPPNIEKKKKRGAAEEREIWLLGTGKTKNETLQRTFGILNGKKQLHDSASLNKGNCKRLGTVSDMRIRHGAEQQMCSEKAQSDQQPEFGKGEEKGEKGKRPRGMSHPPKDLGRQRERSDGKLRNSKLNQRKRTCVVRGKDMSHFTGLVMHPLRLTQKGVTKGNLIRPERGGADTSENP